MLSLHFHHCPVHRSVLLGHLVPTLLSVQPLGTACPQKQPFPSESVKVPIFMAPVQLQLAL